MPQEVVNLIAQLGIAGIFFYLYWITNQRLQQQEEKHDADIKQLYEMRVSELKLIARLPTNLEG